ncbi:glycosyltransferase family 2 protein [Caldifermentibacillus hisashii]|uniref:glycosyltransferase family 2 protein n=1 Tax=Caldifermentibacillus hisashii TaxID=996558 RepID=UPI002E093418|nr:glycosyltransferase family 2 protein [Caldifermentibacillus hisashii]
MINKTISVIVPIFNSEKHLYKCIRSIINQTYSLLDIILINDGSTDNSGKICDEMRKVDKRIRVVHSKNNGVSSARNLGIDMARGEFIKFVDSDDFINPDLCENLLNDILKEDADLVICGLKFLHEHSTKVKNVKVDGLFSLNHFIRENIDRISNIIIGSPCNKLYKASIIKERNILFDTDINYAEDLLFNYRYLGAINKVFSTSNYSYNYNRIVKNSLAQKFREDCFESSNLMYSQTISFLDRQKMNKLIDYSAVYNRFSTLFVSQIEYIYRSDSTLSRKQRELLIEKEFSDPQKITMINNSKLRPFHLNFIWFLTKRRLYTILSIFCRIKNSIKENQTIFNLYKKVFKEV